ncbi:hypothetical protein [Paenarthrobacter sp. NPDC057981]|uniref:hypothetical protein n=1 Tax=Paenarthrobacter sp. NPDC057981 TaxID=3346297 RepID=UPI0036D7A0FF
MTSLTELRRQRSYSQTMYARKQERYAKDLENAKAHIEHLDQEIQQLEDLEEEDERRKATVEALRDIGRRAREKAQASA